MNELTDKQDLFLNILFEDGLPVELISKAKEAYVKAGYSEANVRNVYTLLRRLKQEIIERNMEYMIWHSAESINALQEIVRTPTKPGADTIIKAANSLLDRGGFGKKEFQEIEIKADKGIVVLPAKKD